MADSAAIVGVAYMSNAMAQIVQNLTADHALAVEAGTSSAYRATDDGGPERPFDYASFGTCSHT